jgi:nucleoside-diphosphate-sugar epimerase
MPRYVVTGGAGFIGSHLTEELLRRGQSVRIVDNFITGRRENAAMNAKAELIEGDVSEPAVAAKAVAGCEFVIH